MLAVTVVAGLVVGGLALQHHPRSITVPAVAAPPEVGAGVTGIPSGAVLTRVSGIVTLRNRGATYSAHEVTGRIDVAADNVTVVATRVLGASPYGISLEPGFTGLRIVDSEISGSAGCDFGIGFSDYVALRVDVHGCADGLKVGQDTSVLNSTVHDLRAGGDHHSDGLQATGGSHLVIEGNTIRSSGISCIMLGNEDGSLGDVTILRNVLDGGNFTIYAGTGVGLAPVTTITSNVFGSSDYYGLLHQTGTVSWIGNHSATGAPLALP